MGRICLLLEEKSMQKVLAHCTSPKPHPIATAAVSHLSQGTTCTRICHMWAGTSCTHPTLNIVPCVERDRNWEISKQWPAPVAKLCPRLYRRGRWSYFNQNWFAVVPLSCIGIHSFFSTHKQQHVYDQVPWPSLLVVIQRTRDAHCWVLILSSGFLVGDHVLLFDCLLCPVAVEWLWSFASPSCLIWVRLSLGSIFCYTHYPFVHYLSVLITLLCSWFSWCVLRNCV